LSYGPKGEFIILATLDRIFKDTISTSLHLTMTLKDVFQNETVDSEPGESYHCFWEGVDSEFTTSPIRFRDFVDYILLPEAATLLIAQDLDVSKAEAYGIWARSKDYGNAFHGNVDDGTIDDINIKNIKDQVVFYHCLLFCKSFLVNSHFSAHWEGRWTRRRKRFTTTSICKEGTGTTCDFYLNLYYYTTALT
jgi:RTC4-like domain